jgi:hypothetical protein
LQHMNDRVMRLSKSVNCGRWWRTWRARLVWHICRNWVNKMLVGGLYFSLEITIIILGY